MFIYNTPFMCSMPFGSGGFMSPMPFMGFYGNNCCCDNSPKSFWGNFAMGLGIGVAGGLFNRIC